MDSLSQLQQKISDLFPSFESETKTDLSTIVNQVSAWEDKSKQLLEVPISEVKTIRDLDYLVCSFKTLIDIGLRALTKMEGDLKLGSPAKDKEALALMQNSVAISIEKMTQFRFKLLDIEMFQVNTGPQVQSQTNIINIEASSSDMMDLIEKAKSNSEIRKVEAKFKIETEKSF